MTPQEPSYENEVREPDLHDIRVGRASRSGVSRRWLAVGALLAALALTFIFGIQPRLEARDDLKKETASLNVMTVSATKPKLSSQVQELILPGSMQAFSDTPIYARTTGYLKRWYADIGKRVKAGELLAEIDAPELDDQLLQAKADHATAEANYRFAQSTAARWEALLKKDSVSRQEADEKRNDMAARKAVLDAARYHVARLEKLQSYKRLYAPFDGVITARNVEVGMLIDAGGGTARELFHIAATRKMRVFVNVPQAYARDVVPGGEAEVKLTELPGRSFKGKLARTTQSIDASTRTLLAEVEIDNASGELLPGGYARVHMKLSSPHPVLVLPVNTLLFRPEGVMVAVLRADQKAILTPVQLGRDFGTEVEVVSGIDAKDSIILNPSDSLVSGAQVRLVQEAAAKPAE
jgi:RND family efflux transporter MFP subunit